MVVPGSQAAKPNPCGAAETGSVEGGGVGRGGGARVMEGGGGRPHGHREIQREGEQAEARAVGASCRRRARP